MIDEKKLIKDIFYVDGKRIPDIDCAGEPVMITFEELYKIINNQSKVDEWITVEERLPEEHDMDGVMISDLVLVTVFDCEENEYFVDSDNTVNGKWCFELTESVFKVTAWMPLPKPYGGNIK